MGAPAIPAWQYIDWYYKDLITKVKLNQMMEDTFYAYQRRVKNGNNKLGLELRVDPALPLQKVNILADALSVEDIEITDLNVSADITVAGVGGLDAGAEAANQWYSIWVIHNQTDSLTRALLSTSATAPTMPTNYTKKRRVGWVRNSSSNFLQFYHIANWVYLDIRGSVLNLGNAAAYTDVDCSSFVPPTSRIILLNVLIILGSSATRSIYLRTNGGTGENFKFQQQLSAPDKLYSSSVSMMADSSQIIEYKSDNADSTLTLHVVGYYDPS